MGERGTSDRLEDAVDYVEVARAVQEISDGRQYELLEALAAAVADALRAPFSPERVRVRVRKPEVRPAGLEGIGGVTVDETVTRAYVGLGANLGDRERTLRQRSRCSPPSPESRSSPSRRCARPSRSASSSSRAS